MESDGDRMTSSYTSMTSTLPRKLIVTAVCQGMTLWGTIHGVKSSVCAIMAHLSIVSFSS